eukprot:CAMPEP_0197626510 /NCGR_PEP_ID=MMETSP1338-20131121/5442_1 /TAXON_ID=43686 ORGANISM="Pelagodinium beii, Strain RCC1491" /NCGR_SAMPLE_ID=MMETSP1338 /ASSEMBLY_ACC=CAM_ASM_000754 /LENGTH=1078 /DNA_ID=CAMNT_0043197051 /DNA_START=109 /DNA_END=3345 /DNA_ORIENTATION=-
MIAWICLGLLIVHSGAERDAGTRGDLDLEDDMLSEDDLLGEGYEAASVAAGLKQLLSAADNFMASKHVADEMRALKASKIHRGFAQFGLTLEDMFRFRVLQAHLDMHADKVHQVAMLNESAQPPIRVNDKGYPLCMEDREDVCSSNWVRAAVLDSTVDDDSSKFAAKNSLESYCIYRNLMTERQKKPTLGGEEPVTGNAKVDFDRNGLAPPAGPRGPAGGKTAEEMLTWRRQQAHKMNLVIHGNGSGDSTELQHRMNGVYGVLLDMKQVEDEWKKIFEDAEKVDWKNLKTSKDPMACVAGLWFKQKSEFDKYQQDCDDETAKMSKNAAEETSGLDTVAQAEQVLQEVKKESREEAGSKETLGNEVSAIKDDAKKAETMIDNPSEKSVAEAGEIAKDMDRRMSASAKKVCADARADESGGLQKVLDDAKKDATKLPTLLIRGSSMQVGPGVVAIEEVVDLRNMEVGEFVSVSTSVGSSSLGVGIGGYLGIADKGYKENWTLEDAYQTGVGIAASMFGVSVQRVWDADNSGDGPWIPDIQGVNAITIGIAVQNLPSIPLPGAEIAAAGSCGAFRAQKLDESSFGSFLQANASEASGFGMDCAVTKSYMLNSECYESTQELIDHMNAPWKCKHCKTGKERGLTTGYRILSRLGLIAAGASNGAVIGSAGGPFGAAAGALIGTLAAMILPNVIFKALAELYSVAYGPETPKGRGYQKQCSTGSTNMRNIPENFLRQLDKMLSEIVYDVVQLDRSATNVRLLMNSAPEVHETSEFHSFRQKVGVCADAPDGVFNEERYYKEYEALDLTELQNMCANEGFMQGCEGKKRAVDKLVLWKDVQDDLISIDDLRDLHYRLTQKLGLATNQQITQETLRTVNTLLQECEKRVEGGQKKKGSMCEKGETLFNAFKDWKNEVELLQSACNELVKGGCATRGMEGFFFGHYSSGNVVDNEMLVLMILKSVESKGRMVQNKNGDYLPENIFGSCTKAEDCTMHLANAECRKMKSGTSACRCKSNSCYTYTGQQNREHQCTVKGEGGTSVTDVMDVVDRRMVGLKMAIGSVAGQLKEIADGVRKEPASSLMQR